MRRTLDRVTLVTAATTAGVAALGTTAVVAYVVTSRPDVVRDWLGADPSVGILRFAAAAAIMCLAALERVVVRDDDLGLAEIEHHVRRNKLARAVVVVGIRRQQDAKPVANGDPGRNQQKAP